MSAPVHGEGRAHGNTDLGTSALLLYQAAIGLPAGVVDGQYTIGQVDANGFHRCVLPSGSVVGGTLAFVAASFTRPANVTAYSANQTVSNSTSTPAVMTFTNLARVIGGSGYIVKARIITDQSTNVARFRLHLFHTAPTAINDGSAFTTLWANRATTVGVISFAAAGTEGAGSDSAYALLTSGSGNLPIPYVCDAADRNLYGILETLDAFTPASGQNIQVELTVDNN